MKGEDSVGSFFGTLFLTTEDRVVAKSLDVDLCWFHSQLPTNKFMENQSKDANHVPLVDVEMQNTYDENDEANNLVSCSNGHFENKNKEACNVIAANLLEAAKDPRSALSSSSSQSARGGVLCCRICCSVSRNHEYIPKLEPFSRSKMERILKDPPLIQKSENQLADYCSVLDGEESYDCWKAYFELKDLEKESPKEEVERLIIEAGGVKSLIGCIHGIADIHKVKKQTTSNLTSCSSLSCDEQQIRTRVVSCPIPDGLPKTKEELQEEEEAKMPDSPFTRLLRTKGTHPAWYSPSLDN